MTTPSNRGSGHAMRTPGVLARHGVSFVLGVLVGLLIGCVSPTAPDMGTPIPTLPEYRRWWSAMERCSGLRGSIDEIQFSQVEAMSNQAVARWYPGRIVLTSLFVRDSLVVSHEMMHALIGKPGHPATYFRERCGDLVRDGP